MRYDSSAKHNESSINPIRTGRDNGPANASIRSRTGQCHRYQEYERRPISVSGRILKNLEIEDPAGARRTNTVETVGRSAAIPGKGVAPSYKVPAKMIPIKPSQPSKPIRKLTSFR